MNLRIKVASWLAGSDYEVVSSSLWYSYRGKVLSGSYSEPEVTPEPVKTACNCLTCLTGVSSAAFTASRKIFEELKRDTTLTGPMISVNQLAHRASCDSEVVGEAIEYLARACPDVFFESDESRSMYRMRVRSSQSKVIDVIAGSKVLGGSA